MVKEDHPAPIHTPRPRRTIAYFDTVRVRLVHHPGKKFMAKLRTHCRDAHHGWKPMPRRMDYPFWVEVQTPSARALRMLDRVFRRKKAFITRADPALDFLCGMRADADALHVRFRQYFLPHRIFTRVVRDGTITYFAPRKEKGRVPVAYSDKECRVLPGVHCLHIEVRTKSGQSLRRIGIRRPSHLMNFDHAKYWNAELRFASYSLDRLSRVVTGRTRAKRPAMVRVGPLEFDHDKRVAWILRGIFQRKSGQRIRRWRSQDVRVWGKARNLEVAGIWQAKDFIGVNRLAWPPMQYHFSAPIPVITSTIAPHLFHTGNYRFKSPRSASEICTRNGEVELTTH